MSPSLAARAADWALELVAIPSVNGTPGEAMFAERLRARLAGLPAFAGRADSVWTIPVPGDPLGRAAVAALLPGRGTATVVLTGHFDTVRTDDYGDLAPLATRPQELAAALADRLGGDTAAGARALADLRGGAFLPGRGLLDMKSGLAAGLAVIEALAEEPEREGNLLFLAVPDEEAGSAGARAAAPALRGIAERLGLSLEAAINLDATVDDGDGTEGRIVALGTVGKLLPAALVVGRAVHAAESARGVNAGLLAAAIVEAVEWSGALAERTGDEPAAPPTLLTLRDDRTAYDVTTPATVWAYWNVMTHRRGPAEVLAALAGLCRGATAGALGSLAERLRATGLSTDGLPVEAPVLTFAELRREVFERDPGEADRFAGIASELARGGVDVPEQCRRLTLHLWSASRRPGPAVVLGFASIPYLPTEPRGEGGRRLEAAARAAVEAVAARHGTGIAIRRYFPGISDMSFLGQADPAAVPAVAENTPAWGAGVAWPADGAIAGLPIVNAGPWGRDYHTPLERLHTGYAFEVLPELVLEIVRRVLRQP